MTMHVHVLGGCVPTPLAHYLKSLAVLRLVAEQADPKARGWFEADVFRVATVLDREALVSFFLDRYAPTPLVAPWNGGSGFYPKDNKSGIEPIVSSSASRFAAYAEAIAVCTRLVRGATEAPKDEPKFALQAACRRELGDRAVAWMAAAVVLGESPSDKPRYPALLGTGGNDGRLDFTNNFMQRLVELIDPADGAARPEARGLLTSALFGDAQLGLGPSVIGQFHPGAAGGFNATSSGFGADGLVNTWDFVLMLEGALVLGVSASRQMERETHDVQAAAPFAVRSSAAGYGSAAGSDPSVRGEQWMPLWDHPATIGEVRALFAEGRMQLGRSVARGTLDAARAVAGLGVARGVRAFERFGFFERNGQANLAVPLGRFDVRPRPEVRLLDEIDEWVDALRRSASDDHAPASIQRAARQVDAAMLDVAQRSNPLGWQRLLAVLGQAESCLVAGPRFAVERRVRPIPPLSAGWLEVIDDGSVEVRLAAAIASQQAPREHPELGPFRVHLMPLDEERGHKLLAAGTETLRTDPRVVMTELDLVTDLGAVVTRRLVDAHRVGANRIPLVGSIGAPLADVEAFVLGDVVERRVLGLLRGLTALRWTAAEVREQAARWHRSVARVQVPLASHALFRAVYRTADVKRARQTTLESSVAALLRGGRLADAARSGVERLTAQGLRPRLGCLVGSPVLARRLLAALAIPLTAADQQRAVDIVCKPEAPEERSENGDAS